MRISFCVGGWVLSPKLIGPKIEGPLLLFVSVVKKISFLNLAGF
jgi:hypothetical protein